MAVDRFRGPFQVFLRTADGAAPVNGPGQGRPDVRERNDPGAVGQQPGVEQRLAPLAQVVAAHDAHRPADAFVRRRFDGDLVDDLAVQIDGLSHVSLPDGTEYGLVGLARVRIRALRGGQAVDDQVHLAQPGSNKFHGLPLDLVGVGIAIYISRDQSVFRRVPVVSRGVIESRRTASGTAAFAFEKHPHRAGAVHRPCRDARRQSVSRRSADHQYTERSGAVLLVRLSSPCNLDLGVDIRSATGGMRRGTDKAPDAWLNDGRGHKFYSLPVLNAYSMGTGVARRPSKDMASPYPQDAAWVLTRSKSRPMSSTTWASEAVVMEIPRRAQASSRGRSG